MNAPEEVSPEILDVELTDDGVEVEYLDGRTVFYHGIPTPRTQSVETVPGKHIHVLVTDRKETEGILVYINDLVTGKDILESSGVGRILLDPGEQATVFPGVRAKKQTRSIVVEADFESVDGRVFVFEEDAMGERAFELVSATDE